MRHASLIIAASISTVSAIASPFILSAARPHPSSTHQVDTVFIKSAPEALDYDKLARIVIAKLPPPPATQTIDGDLIVKGRLGVGGEPEAGTDYGITVHSPVSASIRFISNEALKDPQREGNQHRHVGTVGVSQDGGLRMDQNNTCTANPRGCVTDDIARRRAYSGFDSMGDMSFYISDVDSTTRGTTAPNSQSLVFRLLDADGNIHIVAHRPGQRIFFQASTKLWAGDLVWEIPFPK